MKEQIEEIQNTLITISKHPIMIKGLEHWSDVIAEELYNAGYRKQKEGEWKKDRYGNIKNCSICGSSVTFMSKYCPKCGAHMKGVDNVQN